MNELTPPMVPNVESAEQQITSLHEQSQSILDRATTMVVDSPESEQNASYALKALAATVEVLKAITEEFRAPAYEYYKTVQKTQANIVKPYVKASEILRGKLSLYRSSLTLEEKEASKPEGLTYRRKWTAECTDIKKLAQAVLDGRIPPQYLQFNQKEGNELAKAMGSSEALAEIYERDGIKFHFEEIPVRTNK